MNIQNILFDLDGTLTDPAEGIFSSITHALEKLNYRKDPADDLRWCIGPSTRYTMMRLLKDESLVEEGVKHYRERYREIGMFQNTPYPGVIETLRHLNDKKIKMYVATAKPTAFAIPILKHFKMDHYFSAIYGSNLDGTMSDKGRLISHILDDQKIEPQSSVMIGDRSFDVVGGKQNGMKTIAVTWGYGNQEELITSFPNKLVDNFQELIESLEGL